MGTSLSVDIFIKSYSGDFDWLKYALRSIAKYWTNDGETVVVVPLTDVDACRKLLQPRQRVVGRAERFGSKPNRSGRPWGYWEQMLVKMEADLYCPAPLILFLDSDCVMTRECSLTDFCTPEGVPIIYWETYDYFRDKHPSVLGWKPMVEAALKCPVEREYMRCNGLIFWRDSLSAFRQHLERLHGLTFLDVVESLPGGGFEEYDSLGFFCDTYEHHRYHFIRTEYPGDWWPIRQNWSWGGLTPEMEKSLLEIVE